MAVRRSIDDIIIARRTMLVNTKSASISQGKKRRFGVYIINSVGIAYHQCEALYITNGLPLYIIKPQELYSIRASRNAMRDFVGVPYNARGTAIIETPRSALLQTATPSATKTMPRSQSNSEDFCIFNKMVHF